MTSAGGFASPAAARTGWQILIAVICTTIATIVALVLSFIIYLRPLVKELLKLVVSCTKAAESMEKASIEFETTSKLMNKDLPTTLDSMERASLEFEELGQSLNILTGGLVKRNKPAKKTNGKPKTVAEGDLESPEQAALTTDEGRTVPQIHHEWNAVEALQAGTLASIRKVANDVSSLTAALAPAMLAWRKRLGFVLERVETKPLPTTLPAQLPAGSEALSEKLEDLKIDIAAAKSATLKDSEAIQPSKAMDAKDLGESEALKTGVGSLKPVSAEKQSSVSTSEGQPADQQAVGLKASTDSTSSDDALKDSTGVQEDGTSTEVTQVVKDVANAAISALKTEASASTEGFTELQERVSKFHVDKNEFSHHSEQSKLDAEGSSVSLARSKDRQGKNGNQEVMNIAEASLGDYGVSHQDSPQLSHQEATEAVLSALANAEKAALAAAEASGHLEHALQKAERQAGIPELGRMLSRGKSAKSRQKTEGVPEGAYDDGMAFLNVPFKAETAYSLQNAEQGNKLGSTAQSKKPK